MEIAAKEKHIPGEVGIWVFVLGDMFIFGLFFVTFAYYRNLDVALFQQSQAKLNQNWGALNTVLLLTSSWFVVIGMSAIRQAYRRMARIFLSLAWLCGLGFGVVKFFEYGEKISHGITLTTNNFFHLLLGMGVLAYMILRLGRNNTLASDLPVLESGASYWHMVDLLWIILFSILYLIQ